MGGMENRTEGEEPKTKPVCGEEERFKTPKILEMELVGRRVSWEWMSSG